MEVFREGKSTINTRSKLIGPIIIQETEQMLDFKLFLKNYVRSCFRRAIEEYRIESAFTLLQPEPILSEYKKEARKFGVKSDFKNPVSFEDKENIKREDTLAFIADLSALFVKNHKEQYNPETIKEADEMLNREEQQVFYNVYLGFGYFIKRVCPNGHYAAMAINDWFDRFLLEKEVIISVIVKEINFTIISDENQRHSYVPKKISLVCTYMLEGFTCPKLIRINGYFINKMFSITEDKIWHINFMNQKIRLNLNELMMKVAKP